MPQTNPSLFYPFFAVRIVLKQREEAPNELFLQCHHAQCFQAALCDCGGELTMLCLYVLSGRRGKNTSEITQESNLLLIACGGVSPCHRTAPLT